MCDQGQSQSGARVRALRLIQENQRSPEYDLTGLICALPPSPTWAKPAPCAEEAALPLPALTLSLLISSGQQAVREAAANWQPSHPALAKGQNLTGHLLAGPFPTLTCWGTPHLSGPLPSWSPLCSDWQVSLCQAGRQMLGTAQAPEP